MRIATIDNIMIEAVAQAFRWQRLLENGTYDCMDEIAKAEKIGPSFVSCLNCESRIGRCSWVFPENPCSANGWEARISKIGTGRRSL